MAKKGKKVGGGHYEFKYREEFQHLMKGRKNDAPKTFLGFKLKNINQLWNWKTLKDEQF